MARNHPFVPGDIIAISGRHARRFIEHWLAAEPGLARAYFMEPLPRGHWATGEDLNEVRRFKAENPECVVLVQHTPGDVRAVVMKAELVTTSATEADVVKFNSRAAWNWRVRLKGPPDPPVFAEAAQ